MPGGSSTTVLLVVALASFSVVALGIALAVFLSTRDGDGGEDATAAQPSSHYDPDLPGSINTTRLGPVVLWKGCPANKVPGWNQPGLNQELARCCSWSNGQCDSAVDANAQPASPPASMPRYFIGSAYAKATNDLMTKPAQWQTVRNSAGYFCHPVGFRPLGSKGAQLLSQFKNKVFLIEESIEAAFESRPRHVLDHWFAVMENGPGWTCGGVFLYVENERMYDKLLNTMDRFKQFVAPLRRMGIPIYLYFSPLGDVWNSGNLATLTRRINGKPWWIAFAEDVGAHGIAVDYPSWHWFEDASAVWKPQLYRNLVVDVAKTSKAAGLKFVWALNGSTRNPQSVAELPLMARQLKALGVAVDTWVVDHFDNPNNSATPETAATVSGQALALIKAGS